MTEFQVDLNQLDGAAEAIMRNSRHMAAMADYCETLGKGGGSFGSLMSNFRSGYESAALSQVRVLDDMKHKVERTSEAVTAVRTAYAETDENIGEALGKIIEDLNRVAVPAKAKGGPR